MDDRRRSSGLGAVGRLVPQVARIAFARQGFAEGAILTDWSTIVGAPLSNHTLPERLAFPTGSRREGTLHLRVASGWGPEVQHLAHRIIERINGHFGYRAVGRLAIRQGPMPPRPKARAEPAPAPADVDPPTPVEGIDNPELKAALARLGTAIAQRAPRER